MPEEKLIVHPQGPTRRERAFACLAGIMPAITRTLVFMKENRGLGKGRLSNQIKAAKEIEKIYRK